MQRSTFADNFLKEIVCKSCGYLKFKHDKITKTVASSRPTTLRVGRVRNLLTQGHPIEKHFVTNLISTGICFAWISHWSGSKSVDTPRIRGH